MRGVDRGPVLCATPSTAEECEPTANGGVITGIGEGTQWCVKARATMVKSNGSDKPILIGY